MRMGYDIHFLTHKRCALTADQAMASISRH